MFTRLHKFILNRKDVGPPLPDVECCVPECTNKASDQWFPSVCALREAGVEIEWVAVCAEHDVILNEQHVRTIFGDLYDEELEQYRKSRTARKEVT